MSQLPHEEIEGKLIAQREALSVLIAHLAKLEMGENDGTSCILDSMETYARFQDHQEDPGAVPSGAAFAIEAASKNEFRRILAEAREQLDALSE